MAEFSFRYSVKIKAVIYIFYPSNSKHKEAQNFKKTSEPCCVGIHGLALAEYSQISIHVPGFQ